MSEQNGQEADQGWREHISPELRDAPQLKDVAGVDSLAQQFIEQQKFLGSSIRVPGEDAGEETRQQFYAKIQKHAPNLIVRPNPEDSEQMEQFWQMAGVPSDASEYETPEGVEVDESWLSGVKEKAKKYGLTKSGLKSFISDQVAEEQESIARSEREQEEDLKGLQKEWGLSTEGRLADISKFAEQMELPESFRAALAENQVGSDWLKAIHNIIQQFGGMGEGREVAFQPGSAIPDSPAEIKHKIAEIDSNPDFLDPRAPGHQLLVKKKLEYMQKLNTEKARG